MVKSSLMKRGRWLWITLSFASLLAFVAATALCIESILPMRMKLNECRIHLVDSRHTKCGITLFDSSGLHFFSFFLNTPRIEGPSVGGAVLPLQPALQAELDLWKNSFGRPVSGHVLGVYWRNGPAIEWPMNLGRIRKSGDYLTITVSGWLLMLLFAILPCIRWLPPAIKRLSDRPIAALNPCRECGYDLRATPRQCPECGTIIIVSKHAGIGNRSTSHVCYLGTASRSTGAGTCPSATARVTGPSEPRMAWRSLRKIRR